MRHRDRLRLTCTAISVAAVLLLGACTAKTDNLDEHGLQPHLNVDLQVPAELKLHHDGTFRIAISQGDKPSAADSVKFEFWPEGQRDQIVTIDGVPVEDGVYTANYSLQDNGIYVVRCLISSGSLEAMPAKRFAIGEEAVMHLAAMEKQAAEGQSGEAETASGELHHH